MEKKLPEKARLLETLKANGFNVPDFIYVSAQTFEDRDFSRLAAFLETHKKSYKVIARSAHPLESAYKGGTFDSLETYADIDGIIYARNRIIRLAKTAKKLSIKRQQIFNHAPSIDLEQMGMVVMPFIDGSSVMAKMIRDHWEFGYCRNREQKVQTEPHITRVPHDRKLFQLSQAIEKKLGFACEIEYIISMEGEIHVVQAKDISCIETLEEKDSDRSIRLDGIRRIRKQRNYRERPVYVMDNKAFYIDIIGQCEDLVQRGKESMSDMSDIIAGVTAYEAELESFALRHQRFAVLGFSIHDLGDLYQIANHYLVDYPDQQRTLSRALHNNQYMVDTFLGEADTLIAKDKFRVNLCSHDAYGIDTVRNPLWSAFWHAERHDAVVKEFKRLGFKTGDTVAIDIGVDDLPGVFRH